MEQFLDKLYNYEYFGTYLMISIAVLILLFIVILFFGKKDQKNREIEATKKLQQLNEDAFKDESITEKVEVNNVPNELEQQKLENDTIIVPTIENFNNISGTNLENTNFNVENTQVFNNPFEVPTVNEEPEIPVSNLSVEPMINEYQIDKEIEPTIESTNILDDNLNAFEELQAFANPVNEFNNVNNNIEENNEEPILSKIEEKPFVFSDVDINSFEEASNIIEPENHEEEVSVPKFSFDIEENMPKEEMPEERKPYTKGPEIFSSVYVPDNKSVEDKKEEFKSVPSSEELEIELPALKKEVNK